MFCFMIDISSLKSLLQYETKHAEYLKFRCFDNFSMYKGKSESKVPCSIATK